VFFTGAFIKPLLQDFYMGCSVITGAMGFANITTAIMLGVYPLAFIQPLSRSRLGFYWFSLQANEKGSYVERKFV